MATVQSEKSIKKESKPIDVRLLAGPIADRGCTDLICFLLFIASVGLMWGIAIYGYKNGTPSRLTAAYDADGKACGLDLPGYDYIYFPILSPNYYNHTVCVNQCPSDYNSTVSCSNNSIVTSCSSNCGSFSSLTSYSSFPGSLDVSKFFCIYPSSILFNRVCYPTQVLSVLNQTSSFSSAVDISTISAWISDLKIAYGMIIGAFFIAFVAGYFSGVIIWSSIILYFVALSVLAGYLYNQSQIYYNSSDTTTTNTLNMNNQQTADALQGFAIFAIIFLVLSFFIFICMFNKIRLAIAIIKTATLFVKDNFSIIGVPPVFGLFIAVFFVWWIISVVYIVATGDITGDKTTPFATVSFNTTTRRMFWYFLFGGLWKIAFFQAQCTFIIGSSVCIWYFSQGPAQGNSGPIRTSIYRSFRYHLGSLAFGSCILAIVQTIRIAFEYMKWQASRIKGENKCTKCLLDYISCILACFERFIEFLNKNAYIQIALTGDNFCTAAKNAFETIWANAGRYSLLSGFGGILTFIGKLFITALTVMISYLVFTQTQYYKDNLISPVAPSILIFVISYCVGVLFMSIYSMACDSILTCYIYDEDLNKQSGGGSAQHCPETLRDFFEKEQILKK